jgi:hypothetical protein
MRNPIARPVKYVTLAALSSIALVSTSPLRAQDTVQTKVRLSRQLANLSRQIDEIKWSSVSIYRVEDELKKRLIEPQRQAFSKDSIEIESHSETIYPGGNGPLPNFYATVLRLASNPRLARDPVLFRERLADAYSLSSPEDLDEQETQQVLDIATRVIAQQRNIPKDYYLISTRDKNNPGLIALVGIEETPGGGFSLKGQPYAGYDLYTYLQPLDGALYGDLKSAVVDRSPSLTSQMFTLRDLNEITLAPTTKARATYLDENRFAHVLTSVSEGRPIRQQDTGLLEVAGVQTDPNSPGQSAQPNMFEYPYEASVGTDIIASFLAYKIQDSLPIPEADWGVELRNNLDELNYPSIWGGRLTLNAILENIKIGAVLPEVRFGGNTIDSSGIGSHQQKILGGYGIAVGGDFAAPLLDNSGLFNFYGSYTFGEANTDRLRLSDSAGPYTELGYLIRYVVQGYYSFGFYADAAAKHLFRLKIGGTVYGVDYFAKVNDGEGGDAPPPTKLMKTETTSRGGVSGKIEYMKTGQAIPWGAGIQYFDQSILGNIWLQFAINRRIDLKVEGKYFTSFDPTDRLRTHPWENANLIVPSVSVKYHFGQQ